LGEREKRPRGIEGKGSEREIGWIGRGRKHTNGEREIDR
jgi:hypothetical protein